MPNRLKIYSWLKLLSFVPFFLAMFAIITQSKNSVFVLTHASEYVQGKFVVNGMDTMVNQKGIKNIILKGTVNDSIIASLSLEKLKGFYANRNLAPQIGTFIHIWYIPLRKAPIYPRINNDRRLSVGKYIYPDFRIAIFIGIPFFILFSILYKRERKRCTPENKEPTKD